MEEGRSAHVRDSLHTYLGAVEQTTQCQKWDEILLLPLQSGCVSSPYLPQDGAET